MWSEAGVFIMGTVQIFWTFLEAYLNMQEGLTQAYGNISTSNLPIYLAVQIEALSPIKSFFFFFLIGIEITNRKRLMFLRQTITYTEAAATALGDQQSTSCSDLALL